MGGMTPGLFLGVQTATDWGDHILLPKNALVW